MNPEFSDWIVIGISALTVLNLFFVLLSAYWKLSLAEQHLGSCPIVLDARRVWRGNDPIARLHRLCIVALVFTMPGLLEKRGLIDRHEADQVPLSLRIWIAGPLLSSCVVFLSGIGFWLMEKLGGV